MGSATSSKHSIPRDDEPRPPPASLAGFLVTTFIVAAGIHYSLIDSNLLATPDAADIAAFVRGNELVFRLGMALDVALFVLGLFVAFVLYRLLRPVDGPLALLGLVWMTVQTTLALVFESTSVLLLRATGGEPAAALLGLIIDARRYSVVTGMLLFGLAFTIDFYLLFRSRFVPRAISGPGLLAFALSCPAALLALAFPEHAGGASEVVAGLGMLALMALGLWLVIKGTRMEALHEGHH